MLHTTNHSDVVGLNAYQSAVDAADARACAEDSAITAMMGIPRFINEWQCSTGDDIASFLANVMSNMLPRNDATVRDDRLTLSLGEQIDALREQFEAWARRVPSANSKSPLQKYMDDPANYGFDWDWSL